MKFWKTLSIFFGGIITGFLIYMKWKNPDTKIEAETYIEKQEQSVGKIKQKGDSNAQKVEGTQKLTGKVSRQTRKNNRKIGKGTTEI